MPLTIKSPEDVNFIHLAESLPHLVWSSDAQGNVDFYSSRIEQYMGARKTENGWSWEPLVHPEELEETLNTWAHSIQTGEPYSCDHRIQMKDGSYRWHTSRARPFHNQDKKIVKWIGTATDIHETKEVQEKLQAALSARDEFISVASHELKTPLTSLYLQTQIQKRLMDRQDPNAFSKDRLIQVFSQHDKLLARLNRMIEDMLDLTRIKSGRLSIHKSTINLFQVADDVIGRLGPFAMASGIPEIKLSGDHVTGSWDQFRIEQVFTNLITNAIKYGDGRPVKVHVSREGDKAFIRFIDQGLGISPVDFKKIFERFERAENSREISGLGLGLFIAQKIVHAHNGTISVESELRKGSTFTVSLPIYS